VNDLFTIFVASNFSQGWIYVLAGAAGGVYIFFRGFTTLQRKRLILNTPTSKIRSASIGLVEVSGLAVGPHTLLAPITQVPCYYYRTIAWQLKKSGKNEKWEVVAEESLHVPFYLDDNTGRVLVDPQGAEMDIHRDFHEEFSNSLFSTRSEAPANVCGFLGRHGVDSDRKTRVDEYCIKPKNALFVLGTLAQNSGGEAAVAAPQLVTAMGHRGETARLSQVIRLSPESLPANTSSMTPQGKIAAALMKAGINNPAAWAVAGVDDPAHALNNSGSATAATLALETFDPHPPVVLKKGTHNPAFFISWRSQKEILNSLGLKSTAMIWGGPALTLTCVYVLVTYFHLL
jgi:hypothetical protein